MRGDTRANKKKQMKKRREEHKTTKNHHLPLAESIGKSYVVCGIYAFYFCVAFFPSTPIILLCLSHLHCHVMLQQYFFLLLLVLPTIESHNAVCVCVCMQWSQVNLPHRKFSHSINTSISYEMRVRVSICCNTR